MSHSAKNEQAREEFLFQPFLIVVFIHVLAFWGIRYLDSFNVIALLVAHYIFVILGASVTLHHFLSHRSFEFKNSFIKKIFLFLGTSCLQGGPIFWAAHHKQHHAFSDSWKDPHSRQRGFWWSHILWLFYKNPNGCHFMTAYRNCGDLMNDQTIKWFEENYLSVNVAFLLILIFIALVTGRPEIFFIVGPMRIVTGWHATWLINSYSHSANKEKKSFARNAFWPINLLIPGEGMHENHHRLPSSHQENKVLFALDKLSIIRGKKPFIGGT